MQKHPSQMSEDERIFLKRYLSQYYRAKERQKILRERLADIRTELDPAGKNGRNTSLAIKMAEIEDRIARQSEIEATAILDIMDVLEKNKDRGIVPGQHTGNSRTEKSRPRLPAMLRLFLFPFWILGSPLAHPGFHAPAVARKFCAVFRASKKHKTIRPETKHPLSGPAFYQR